MSHSHQPKHRFVPRIEALEERAVLSTASFNPTTGLLQVTGTDQADHIRVVDTKPGDIVPGGGLQVFDNEKLIFSTSLPGAVKHIKIDTLAGNDTVSYQLVDSLFFTHRTMDVDLGEGDDWFNADLAGSLGLSASLKINVLGQIGNDHLSATMKGDVNGITNGSVFLGAASRLDLDFDGGAGHDTMGVTLQGSVKTGAHLGVDLHGGDDKDSMRIDAVNVNVAPKATLDLNAFGQGGQDVVAVNYSGLLRGFLNTQEDGGLGNDRLSANVFLKAGSNGAVSAQTTGGQGNNTMSMFVRKEVATDPAAIAAHVDGDFNFDSLLKTGNVTDANCELVAVIQ